MEIYRAREPFRQPPSGIDSPLAYSVDRLDSVTDHNRLKVVHRLGLTKGNRRWCRHDQHNVGSNSIVKFG